MQLIICEELIFFITLNCDHLSNHVPSHAHVLAHELIHCDRLKKLINFKLIN